MKRYGDSSRLSCGARDAATGALQLQQPLTDDQTATFSSVAASAAAAAAADAVAGGS